MPARHLSVRPDLDQLRHHDTHKPDAEWGEALPIRIVVSAECMREIASRLSP
ncbi:MAG TPA: hypothetical protein VH277_17155 [Gemmatimonadaceae bacterium]|jgi:hypothetical protein|nr:hypothetical protein [Gemmatimonadaceae bacterium]